MKRTKILMLSSAVTFLSILIFSVGPGMAAEEAGESASGILAVSHVIEETLDLISHFLEHFFEAIAIFIIASALIASLGRIFFGLSRMRDHQHQAQIRVEFGESLAMALTFLLGADVVATAISPSWSAVGKLAAIAAIRTFLSYFLILEIKELEEKTAHGSHPAPVPIEQTAS